MIFRFSLYGFLKNQRYFEPFMMLFLLGSGNSFATVGFLIGFRELCINATNIPAGAIADLYGRRRCMLVSYLAYMIAFLCFGLCPDQLPYLFIAVFFFGIGEAFREGTHKSMIFTWLRLNGRMDEKTKVYGYTRSWSKIGSAVSIPIATAIAYCTDHLNTLFLAALVPYSIGFISLCTYPKELDGRPEGEASIKRIFVHMWQTLRDSIKIAGLRRLMVESMSFEGFFDVVKDYLQPMIRAMVLGVPLLLTLGDDKRSTLLIGAVYFIFHLGSAWSSRQSHRLSQRFGDDDGASGFMWWGMTLIYLAMLPCLALDFYYPVLVLFFLLFLMQGAWRPLIISRFDAYSPETHGTSILSVESQSQTFAKMLFAPALGFAIDLIARAGSGGSGKFWPIAAVGVVISVSMVLSVKTGNRRGRIAQ
ncbi:MAG: transporter [Proteobacteria bacterium]|nr:transporter [Pseudomonadota bacterium]